MYAVKIRKFQRIKTRKVLKLQKGFFSFFFFKEPESFFLNITYNINTNLNRKFKQE